MQRLKDFAKKGNGKTSLPLTAIEGLEVMVTDVRFAEGHYGEYAFIDVTDEKGQTLIVLTGARQVLEALHAAKEAKAFPLMAKFTRNGKRWEIQ